MPDQGSSGGGGRIRSIIRFAPLALLVWVLVGGSVGLLLEGNFESAAIGLLLFSVLVSVLVRPFARLPYRQRVYARVATTGVIIAGWFVAGAVAWDWSGTAFAVAGGVAVVTLVIAARP